MSTPLAYERQVMRREDLGAFIMLWRRQGHKTTTMAKRALKAMMKKAGILVTFASVSLSVGREMLVKEAQVLNSAFTQFKNDATKANLKFEHNADGLTFDDFCEIFEAGRIEAKIWHSKTTYSRTIVIAPNVATARGWSGHVMIDEIGFIKDLKDLMEAMEPILISDPAFRLLMATTPPNDDGHYSYELTVPPTDTTFHPCADGHWYQSQAGFWVHRVNAYDAEVAGLKMYDLSTREQITPAQHREKALDRDAWDRNYGLIFKTGGACAVSLGMLHHAQLQGQCVFGYDEFPSGWESLIGNGRLTLGQDLATTENQTSNPSSLTILERDGSQYHARLILAWKTADPAETEARLRHVFETLKRIQKKARRLCVDATNERFFATNLRKMFTSETIVELVIFSESIEYQGQKMSIKTYSSNLVINELEDGRLALPDDRYIREDFRLVKREKGCFAADTDGQGRHADTFDSTKLAFLGQIRGGPTMAEALAIGSYGVKGQGDQGWKNKYDLMREKGAEINL